MKKTNNMMKVFIAAIALSSLALLSSCNKENIRNQPAVHDNTVSSSSLANPIAAWGFDSTFTEAKQDLNGIAHKGATFSSTEDAKNGIAAFASPKNGYVSCNNAGSALPKLTTGFSVDFWVNATPKEGGTQCIWCMPQTVDQTGNPAFWPTQHVLLDNYNKNQGDTALIKVMFKANRNINYNEQWNIIGGIPKFYRHWSHIQYCYDGATSKFTLIVNEHKYLDKITLYTSDPADDGVPLGNIAANPGPKGVVFGAFQNNWKPDLFGPPQVWMLPFRGEIDAFKVYNTAIF